MSASSRMFGDLFSFLNKDLSGSLPEAWLGNLFEMISGKTQFLHYLTGMVFTDGDKLGALGHNILQMSEMKTFTSCYKCTNNLFIPVLRDKRKG